MSTGPEAGDRHDDDLDELLDHAPQEDTMRSSAPGQEREAPSGPAVGTLVWGCVVLAVAALLGAWELADLRLDLSLVVPVGMVLLGLLLVVGAVATAVRSNRG